MLAVLDGRAPAPAALRGAAIALGVLDGVHRGHQGVFAAACEHAAALGAPKAAAVFEPHPRHFFDPAAAPFRLQSAAQRARALAALGADAVFQIAFNAELAALPAEDFIARVLVEAIGARHVCVGADYRFGKGRAGDVGALRAAGARHGFGVTVLDAILDEGLRISSTSIRALLREGDVVRAARLLSRPFAIEGAVIEGAKRGRTIDFPTANVALGAYVRPRFGVYAVRVRIGDDTHAGVANIGVKPTVGAAEPLLEAHIFDFAGDLYGREIEVALIEFIRPEQKFDSFDALRRQIAADADRARLLLK